MLPHQQRVIDERNELVVKLNALDSFIPSEIFASLSTEDQHLLTQQRTVMNEYRRILDLRINRFNS